MRCICGQFFLRLAIPQTHVHEHAGFDRAFFGGRSRANRCTYSMGTPVCERHVLKTLSCNLDAQAPEHSLERDSSTVPRSGTAPLPFVAGTELRINCSNAAISTGSNASDALAQTQKRAQSQLHHEGLSANHLCDKQTTSADTATTFAPSAAHAAVRAKGGLLRRRLRPPEPGCSGASASSARPALSRQPEGAVKAARTTPDDAHERTSSATATHAIATRTSADCAKKSALSAPPSQASDSGPVKLEQKPSAKAQPHHMAAGACLRTPAAGAAAAGLEPLHTTVPVQHHAPPDSAAASGLCIDLTLDNASPMHPDLHSTRVPGSEKQAGPVASSPDSRRQPGTSTAPVPTPEPPGEAGAHKVWDLTLDTKAHPRRRSCNRDSARSAIVKRISASAAAVADYAVPPSASNVQLDVSPQSPGEAIAAWGAASKRSARGSGSRSPVSSPSEARKAQAFVAERAQTCPVDTQRLTADGRDATGRIVDSATYQRVYGLVPGPCALRSLEWQTSVCEPAPPCKRTAYRAWLKRARALEAAAAEAAAAETAVEWDAMQLDAHNALLCHDEGLQSDVAHAHMMSAAPSEQRCDLCDCKVVLQVASKRKPLCGCVTALHAPWSGGC